MQRKLDVEAIFPINDAASAALMAIKADYLHRAGIITEWEERWVYSRVRPFLDDDSLIPPVLDDDSLIPPARESATPLASNY